MTDRQKLNLALSRLTQAGFQVTVTAAPGPDPVANPLGVLPERVIDYSLAVSHPRS